MADSGSASSSSSPSGQSREAVVSAANLLLVAALKLNRALVPVLLRWLRGRRTNWIRRASIDVYQDLKTDPNKRFLCFGECCLATYELDYPLGQDRDDSDEEFDDDDSDDDDDEMEKEQTGTIKKPTPPTTIPAPAPTPTLPPPPPPPPSTKVKKHTPVPVPVPVPSHASTPAHPSTPTSTDPAHDDGPPSTSTIATASTRTVAKPHMQTPTPSTLSHDATLPSGPGADRIHSQQSVPEVSDSEHLSQRDISNIQTQMPVTHGNSKPIEPFAQDNLVPSIAIPFVERSLGKFGNPVGVQGMSVQERYFRLLVAQEEIHRRKKVIPFVYMSVLYAWVTLISLIVYSAIIIGVVVAIFPMSSEQFIIFSFSLVTTATVSEADKLLKVIKKRMAKTSDTSAKPPPVKAAPPPPKGKSTAVTITTPPPGPGAPPAGGSTKKPKAKTSTSTTPTAKPDTTTAPASTTATAAS